MLPGWRVETEDGGPDVLYDLSCRSRWCSAIRAAATADRALRAAHRQADREQPLDDVIVQVPADAFPFCDQLQFVERGPVSRAAQRQRRLFGKRGRERHPLPRRNRRRRPGGPR